MRFLFSLIPCLLLVACATPRERCINDAAAPYRAALKERAEIAKALARGYVTETEWEQVRVFTRCEVAKGRFVPCWETETRPVTHRVPVDRVELRRRDAQLARDLPGLQRAAERGAAICRETIPEG